MKQDKKQADEIENKDNSETGKLYWIFLTTGKSLEGVASEEVEKMQAAHLGNFKKLAEESKLLTAGPMTDPEKKLRGIVVVKASGPAELNKMFEPDPYVQKGYLTIEATEMEFDHGVINTKITPQGLEEYRLAIIEKVDREADSSSEVASQNKKFISEMNTNPNLLMTVFFPGHKFGRTAVMILKKQENDDAINETLNSIPSIEQGIWKSRVFPLYMGKGSLTPS